MLYRSIILAAIALLSVSHAQLPLVPPLVDPITAGIGLTAVSGLGNQIQQQGGFESILDQGANALANGINALNQQNGGINGGNIVGNQGNIGTQQIQPLIQTIPSTVSIDPTTGLPFNNGQQQQQQQQNGNILTNAVNTLTGTLNGSGIQNGNILPTNTNQNQLTQLGQQLGNNNLIGGLNNQLPGQLGLTNNQPQIVGNNNNNNLNGILSQGLGTLNQLGNQFTGGNNQLNNNPLNAGLPNIGNVGLPNVGNVGLPNVVNTGNIPFNPVQTGTTGIINTTNNNIIPNVVGGTPNANLAIPSASIGILSLPMNKKSVY